jgi:hypothetical protein
MRNAVRVVNGRPRGAVKYLWRALADKYLPTSTCVQVLALALVLAQVRVQVLARAQVLADKYLPTITCRQLLVLTQVLAHVRVQVLVRSYAAARDSREVALAALASLSWLREVDFPSLIPRLPILRARARTAERSTSCEREATRSRQVLVARTCRQILADKYLWASTCVRGSTCTGTCTSTCRQLLADNYLPTCTCRQLLKLTQVIVGKYLYKNLCAQMPPRD